MRVVHFLNQFFAGLGGEERADIGVVVREGPVGPGRALAAALGEAGEVVQTVICGDNAFGDRPEESAAAVLDAIAAARPDVVVAGPAFGAGRYGSACATVCRLAVERLGLPALTAMHPENPGVELAGRSALVVPTGPTARAMDDAVAAMARLALKLGRGEPLGPPHVEGYLPRGLKRNEFRDRNGAQRAVDMLLARVRGEPFVSEIPLPNVEQVPPAQPVADLRQATVALVSVGGIVPRGNPDRIESRRASKWAAYPLGGLDGLAADAWECIHGGFDGRYANEDPNRVLPLDALRSLERAGAIGRLHETVYVTVGNAAPLSNAQRFGQEIAKELREKGVEAAIFTAT